MRYTNSLTSTHHVRPGFSVIELVIGLMIGAILLTASFTIYQQITKSTIIIQKITSYDTNAMILKDRFQKDLLGISALWFTPKQYEAMKKKPSSTPASAKDSPSKDEKEPQEVEHKKEEEQTQQENNFFYALNNSDGTLNTLSFITTSALQMYGSKTKLFVRVVYTLKKSSTTENRFSLQRKEIEANEFAPDSLQTTGIFYELASHIKSCSLEYGFINKITIQNKNEKAEKPTDDTKATEITWVKDWNEKKDSTQPTIQKPMSPKFVKMNIIFAQDKTNSEQEYELFFTIPIDNIMPYHSFTQQRYQKEQSGRSSRAQGGNNQNA